MLFVFALYELQMNIWHWALVKGVLRDKYVDKSGERMPILAMTWHCSGMKMSERCVLATITKWTSGTIK